jgi:hypothetical protein
VHSISSASALLANSHDAAALDTLLHALGFTTPALPLAQSSQEQLLLPPEVRSARVARAHGALRALVVTITNNVSPRETIQTIARHFSTRVPHLLWTVIVTQEQSPLLAIATWSSHTRPPRVAALVTHRDHVLDSDAETLCELAACQRATTNDVLLYTRWLEILGREAITRRFYRALEQTLHTLAESLAPAPPPDAAHTLALLYTSRLLFLAFLETKGWLNNDFAFLTNGFADCIAQGGSYHRKILEPLFFGTLNTRPHARATRAHQFGKIPFLNGGLFTRTPLECTYRRSLFSDEALGTLYGDVLARYRLTPREDSPAWSEAAVDPEMLGKVFESLMATAERKASGAYYTPHTLVERVTFLALVEGLQTKRLSRDTIYRTLSGDLPDSYTRGLILDRIDELRILDPACGSGAFLVHTLEQLATLRAQLGDIRPMTAIRRTILTQSLYGVDLNPTAVWLCELRLWLSVVIDHPEQNPMRILPLPNLDHQIRVGDSLLGGTFDGAIDLRTARTLTQLRHKYARATGPRKKTLARLLARTERTRALAQIDQSLSQLAIQRKDLLTTARSPNLFAERTRTTVATRRHLYTLRTRIRQLRQLRRSLAQGAALPFAFATHFPNVADAGGFHIVLGNPPWVRIHHIPRTTRETLRATFSTFRTAAWHSGAKNARAGLGFAAQVDLAALFLERATDLLTPHGSLALLLPTKLWHSLAGGGTRQLATTRLTLTTLEDLSASPPAFDAATYPSLLVARRISATNTPEAELTSPAHPTTEIVIHRPATRISWYVDPKTLALDATPGSPWLLIPPKVRRAFDTIAHAGIPLAQSRLGRPLLGVKSGCNEAFLVRTIDVNNPQSSSVHQAIMSTSSTHTGIIEQAVLRPLLRGAMIRPWNTPPSDAHIIWTHDAQGRPLSILPPLARRWFAPWRYRLTRRSDARQQTTWWSLFRTECSHNYSPRIVWSDFGRTLRATILQANDPTVPLNTCYVLPCATSDDAYALATILNSPLATAWINAIAEPAHGGYHRYLGWTIALLPIPHDWERTRTCLAPIAQAALLGDVPSPDDLLSAVLSAYQITPQDAEPLLAWNTP